jgi:hypothetical protein
VHDAPTGSVTPHVVVTGEFADVAVANAHPGCRDRPALETVTSDVLVVPTVCAANTIDAGETEMTGGSQARRQGNPRGEVLQVARGVLALEYIHP